MPIPSIPLAGFAATVCFLRIDCSDASVATREMPQLWAADAKLTLPIMALNAGSANTAEMLWAGNDLIEQLESTSKAWYERGMGQCWHGKFSTLAPGFEIKGQTATTSCC